MHGLGTEDNPLFPGMHEAAAMVTGATLAAARAVWTSAAQHGASLAGDASRLDLIDRSDQRRRVWALLGSHEQQE